MVGVRGGSATLERPAAGAGRPPSERVRPRSSASRRSPLHVRNESLYWRRRATAVGAVLTVAVGPLLLGKTALDELSVKPHLRASGVHGGYIDKAELSRLTLRGTVSPAADAGDATLTVDGHRLVRHIGRLGMQVHPIGLREGAHKATVSVPRTLLWPARRTRTFVVDATPPRLDVKPSVDKARIGEPVTFSGTVEPGAHVTADGKAVAVRRGRFDVRYSTPPGTVKFVATDRAGNKTSVDATAAVLLPDIRAVHVSGYAWADQRLRDGVLGLADAGLINAVELDIKEEDGTLGHRSSIPLVNQIGASHGLYDLKTVVDQLHGRHLRVIGRVVAFRDAVLAGAAWKAGHKDQVIQTPSGDPYKGYGGFTNFASPAVRHYNEDIAVEAAHAGVDDILYDYVRRPDGPLASMAFPGIQGSPEDNIVNFLAETRAQLRDAHALLGASVFGVSATRPLEVAQDIPRIAREVNYVAPMVYPSHWKGGEYGVADPNHDPYDIVLRSLQDFQRVMAGTSAKLVPWLQDFSLGATYGVNEVKAQIQAAADAGINDWIMWDPAVTYTGDALPKPQ